MTFKCWQKSTLFLFSIVVLFASCKKQDTPASETPQVSKLRLLTANVWIYDSVYTNWGTSTQSVVFARNSPSNSQDWTKSKVKFYVDGTFDEILTTGALRQGPNIWTMNNDSTILNTTGGGFSNSAQILSLTSTRLVWYDNTIKVRGVQVPKY